MKFSETEMCTNSLFFATFQTLTGFENAGNGVFLLSFLEKMSFQYMH